MYPKSGFGCSLLRVYTKSLYRMENNDRVLQHRSHWGSSYLPFLTGCWWNCSFIWLWPLYNDCTWNDKSNGSLLENISVLISLKDLLSEYNIFSFYACTKPNNRTCYVEQVFSFLTSEKSVLLIHIPSLFVMRAAWTTVSTVIAGSMLRQWASSVDLPIWGWRVHSPFVKINLTGEMSSIYILSLEAQLLMFSSLYFFQEN